MDEIRASATFIAATIAVVSLLSRCRSCGSCRRRIGALSDVCRSNGRPGGCGDPLSGTRVQPRSVAPALDRVCPPHQQHGRRLARGGPCRPQSITSTRASSTSSSARSAWPASSAASSSRPACSARSASAASSHSLGTGMAVTALAFPPLARRHIEASGARPPPPRCHRLTTATRRRSRATSASAGGAIEPCDTLARGSVRRRARGRRRARA